MAYDLIAMIASIVLAAGHVLMTDATRRSKSAVVLVVVLSLVIRRFRPPWDSVATILQVCVSIYAIVYWRWSGNAAN